MLSREVYGDIVCAPIMGKNVRVYMFKSEIAAAKFRKIYKPTP